MAGRGSGPRLPAGPGPMLSPGEGSDRPPIGPCDERGPPVAPVGREEFRRPARRRSDRPGRGRPGAPGRSPGRRPTVPWSRTITWPLFSPPTLASFTSIPSRMYLSPTGVRTTRPPAPPTAASRPPFERTVTTTTPFFRAPAADPVERDQADQLVAVDDPAVAIDHDQPVGVAVEGEAQVGAAAGDRPGEGGRRRRPALDVDVDAVGLVVDHLDARRRSPRGPPGRRRRPSRWRSRRRSAGRCGSCGPARAGPAGSARAARGPRGPGRSPRCADRPAPLPARSAPRGRPRDRRRASSPACRGPSARCRRPGCETPRP